MSDSSKLAEEAKLYWTIQLGAVAVLGYLGTELELGADSVSGSPIFRNSVIAIIGFLLLNIAAIYNIVGNYYTRTEAQRQGLAGEDRAVMAFTFAISYMGIAGAVGGIAVFAVVRSLTLLPGKIGLAITGGFLLSAAINWLICGIVYRSLWTGAGSDYRKYASLLTFVYRPLIPQKCWWHHVGPMTLRTRSGHEYKLSVFFLNPSGKCYLVLQKGICTGRENVLVRIESACFFAHLFDSAWCDCGQQWDLALKQVTTVTDGLIVYALDEDGRGLGLRDHVRAYIEQDRGLTSTNANLEINRMPDERDHSIAAQIVESFNPKSVLLLTNNPDRISAFENVGLTVRADALIPEIDEWNAGQLIDKVEKLRHKLDYNHKFWFTEAAKLRDHGSKCGVILWILVVGGRKKKSGSVDESLEDGWKLLESAVRQYESGEVEVYLLPDDDYPVPTALPPCLTADHVTTRVAVKSDAALMKWEKSGAAVSRHNFILERLE